MTACAAKFCNSVICLWGKRPHLLTVSPDGAKQDAIFPQRYQKESADAARIGKGPKTRMLAISIDRPGIGKVDERLAAAQLVHGCVPARRRQNRVFDEIRHPVARYEMKLLAVEGCQGTQRGPAKSMCLIQDRIEYRSEVAGR